MRNNNERCPRWGEGEVATRREGSRMNGDVFRYIYIYTCIIIMHLKMPLPVHRRVLRPEAVNRSRRRPCKWGGVTEGMVSHRSAECSRLFFGYRGEYHFFRGGGRDYRMDEEEKAGRKLHETKRWKKNINNDFGSSPTLCLFVFFSFRRMGERV